MRLFLIFTLLSLPTLTFAQFDTLVNIPGISDPGQDFATYINALYALSIAIAGLLAVIKLVIAGVKYMLTDIVTSKADAKKDIQGALLGLLVVLAAVLILTVINEDITNADIRINPAAEVPEPPPQPTPLGIACGDNNENCEIVECSFFNDESTWYGWMLQVINQPIDNITCQVYCDVFDGTVFTVDDVDSCVFIDSDIQFSEVAVEIAEAVAENNAACTSSPNGCEIISCLDLGPFLLRGCESVCGDDNGIYVPVGNNEQYSQCVRPI